MINLNSPSNGGLNNVRNGIAIIMKSAKVSVSVLFTVFFESREEKAVRGVMNDSMMKNRL
jgi:hypothetical protein